MRTIFETNKYKVVVRWLLVSLLVIVVLSVFVKLNNVDCPSVLGPGTRSQEYDVMDGKPLANDF